MAESGERQKQAQPKKVKPHDRALIAPAKLSDLGITTQDASRAQRLAALPEKAFDAYVGSGGGRSEQRPGAHFHQGGTQHQRVSAAGHALQQTLGQGLGVGPWPGLRDARRELAQGLDGFSVSAPKAGSRP